MLEHDVIVVALGRILNANDEKPDFQILRDILRFPVVVEIIINIDTISDYRTKAYVKSRKIFQEFVRKNVGEKKGLLNKYYSKEVWEVE